MKKLCSYFSVCSILVSAAVLSSAWTYRANQPVGYSNNPLAIADTTRISCAKADSAALLWYNNVQSAVLFGIGPFTVTPDPLIVYNFPGVCSDTLSFRFVVTPSSGPDTTLTYVLIVQDSTPPLIQSSIADSLVITCADEVPDTSTVTVTDNCALDTVIYNQITTIGDCPYSYKLVRTWDAWDGCGQRSTYRQVIVVVDEVPPMFSASFPAKDTIDCSQSPHPDSLGRPMVTDNCDPTPKVTYQDFEAPSLPGCLTDYSIERRWSAVDACGNASFFTQLIYVRDTKAPTFTAPRDTVLDCTKGDHPNVAGRPTNVRDNCSVLGSESVTYKDVIIAATCQNTYTVRRTWFVSDGCKNVDSSQQIIQVRDLTPPVFTRPAQPIQVQCGEGSDVYSFFWDWADRYGDALATDNCNGQVRWVARNAGTSDTLSFPEPVCTPGNPIIFERRVDFIAIDACGLSDTTTAVFQVLDVVPPVIEDCPSDTIIGNSPGLCAATFTLPAPQVSDECFLSVNMFSAARSSTLESADPSKDPGIVPVKPILFTFDLPSNRFASAAGAGILTIRLVAVDGEGVAEYFQVRGEDGTLLGRSASTNAQCGNSTVSLSISPLQVNNWAADGRIHLTLEPFQELGLSGAGMINPLCADGKVEATLELPLKDRENLALEYQINDNPRVRAASIYDEQVTLPFGQNRITYFVTDCAGQVDSCQFMVRVEDREAPQVICPADTTVVLASGTCTAVLNIPLPVSMVDNCSFLAKGQSTLPPDSSQALLSYYATGATNIPLTATTLPLVAPQHTFNQGITQVFYVLADASGNKDTCSFEIRVEDQELPKAYCQPTTLFINPAGLENPQVSAQEINAGSTDNCVITRMEITPSTFSCAQAGTVQDVVLSVFDASGNSARCSTIVRIENLEPEPTASANLCGADTLFLYANPPRAVGGVLYTYKWAGPNGFTSNKENPVLPNISSRNAGSYTVEVTGITGCKASGVVEVSIEDLPLTPELLTADNFCQEDAIKLQSSIAPAGNAVIYRWYRGVAPNGVLLDSTIVPSLTLPGPFTEGIESFYLTVEANGCISRPSASKLVRINKRPVAIPNIVETTICAGQAVSLGTEVFGAGITYAWAGPNGFSSTSQYPAAIVTTMADAGEYQLVVSKYGCMSKPAYVTVRVLAKPARPEISNSGAACAGGEVTLRTGSVATRYTWISPNLLEFPTSISSFYLSNVSKAVSGAWRVAVTVQGCQSDPSLPTTVVVNDLPRPSVATSPAIVCDGGSLTLNASPAIVNATYQWLGPANFSAVGLSATVPAARAQNSGRYTLNVVTPEGCTGNAFMDVDVKPAARIVAVTNDGPDCLSGPTDIRLTASVFPEDDGSYSYNWTGPGGYLSSSRVGIIPKATQLNNGNYRLLVTTAQGCVSSPAITVVDVTDPPKTPSNPTINTLIPGPVCEGSEATLCTDTYQGVQVLYSWVTPNKGIVVTSTPCLNIANISTNDAGVYAVFVTVDGCRSKQSASTTMTVNSKPVISAFSNSPICAGRPLELRATVIAGATYSWTGPNFSSSLAIPQIPEADSARHTGVYTVSAVLNGCRSESVKTVVSVMPTPVQPILASAAPVCVSTPGASLRINLKQESTTAGATYTWFGPLGPLGSTQNPEFSISSFIGYRNGVGSFSVQAQLGACSSTLSAPLEVEINTIPEDIAFAGNDFNACDAEAIYLNGLEPTLGIGRWTLISGPNTAEVVITAPNKGRTAVQKLSGPNTYTFRWTLSNGACIDYSSDDVQVLVSRQDTASAGVDQLVCLSPKITLNAKPSANGVGNWSQSAVQAQLGVRILEPSNPKSPVSGMQPGNLYAFTWTVIGGCGNLSDEVLVLISDPDPYAGPDQLVCTLTGTAQLQADLPTDGSSGRWLSLTPGVSIRDSSKLQAVVSQLQPGANRFVWEIDQGICGADSRDTVVIQYTRSPEAFQDELEVPFGKAIVLPILANDVYSGKVRLRIVEQPTKGTLQLRNDSVLTYTPGINYLGSDLFRYEVCSDGCSCSITTVNLKVGAEAACVVPSIITPNNDGINDVFIVPCLLDESAYPDNQVLILNRSGNEVYRSRRPYQNNWQGTFNGEDLPVGTYFYIVDLGDGSAPMRGFFVIQR